LRHGLCIVRLERQPYYSRHYHISFVMDHACYISLPFSHSYRSLHVCIAFAWLHERYIVRPEQHGLGICRQCTSGALVCSYHQVPACSWHLNRPWRRRGFEFGSTPWFPVLLALCCIQRQWLQSRLANDEGTQHHLQVQPLIPP
jgi:hypothetical protein